MFTPVPSVERADVRPSTFPVGRNSVVSAARASWALGALLLIGLALCITLALASTQPFSDSGGYEGMLRYYLRSGRVDYMKWSQPTFIGLLPVAVPWTRALGLNSASLQWMCVGFTMVLLALVWAWCARVGRPWAALWLALGVLLLPDALKAGTTFLTDIPYVAYLVGFLTAHAQLERSYAGESKAQGSKAQGSEKTKEQSAAVWRYRAIWWACWGVCFALSALTRSFSLLLVAVFGVQWVMARRNVAALKFALACLLGGGVLAALCLLTTRKLGENAIGFKDITTLPLILHGERNALNVRQLIVGVMELALALFPALLLWSVPRKWGRRVLSWRVMPADAVVGAVSLVLGLLFWRKGAFDGWFVLPQVPQLGKALIVGQIALLPFAVPLMGRVLRRGLRTAGQLKSSEMKLDGAAQEAGKTRVNAAAVGGARALPHTCGVLTAIALVHFALMPVLLHPLPRHLMPAGVAILLLVALQVPAARLGAMEEPATEGGERRVGRAHAQLWGASRGRMVATSVLTLGLLGLIWWDVRTARVLDAAVYSEAARLARGLEKQGIAPTSCASRIAGGWTWFCARDLQPGQPAGDYVRRYAARRETAPYVVWVPSVAAVEAPNDRMSPRATLLRSVVVPATGEQRIEVYAQPTPAARGVTRLSVTD